MWVSYSIGMIWAVIGSREVKWIGQVLEHEVSTKSWGNTYNERKTQELEALELLWKKYKKKEGAGFGDMRVKVTLEDGTNRLCRNAGDQLPTYAT
jgi:hypothetical protein